MPADPVASFWEDFINGHIRNFRGSAFVLWESIDSDALDCWVANVQSATWAQKDLPGLLRRVRSDLVGVDNVISFPAFQQFGVTWLRAICCSENEIEDPPILAHRARCAEHDHAAHVRVARALSRSSGRSTAVSTRSWRPVARSAVRPGSAWNPRPFVNRRMHPESLRSPYLKSCVRAGNPYNVPRLARSHETLRRHVSFGSLDAADVARRHRSSDALGCQPERALADVGGHKDPYTRVLDSMVVENWFSQPSVTPKVDAVIAHWSNNLLTKCLMFNKPAVIMPFVPDGQDIAVRAQETGNGFDRGRYDRIEATLAQRLNGNGEGCSIARGLAARFAGRPE